MPDGNVKDVPLGELAVDDKVLIKPGEKIPADGLELLVLPIKREWVAAGVLALTAYSLFRLTRPAFGE